MPELELLALLTARLKQLEARLPGTAAAAVEQWAEENRDSLRGKDADPVTAADIQAVALPWLEQNIRQPKDGESVDMDVVRQQVQSLVDTWLTVHYAEFMPQEDVIARLVESWMSANVRQPKDGADASDEQVARICQQIIRERFRQPKDGDPGKDGVGIEDIYQSSANGITIELTDGRKRQFTLPKSTVSGGGSTTVNKTIIEGIKEIVAGEGIAVDNTDPKRPKISATGGGGSIQKFEVALSGFSYQVTQAQHGLSDIMIRVTRDADGALVSVADAIGLDGLVNIESNTSLSGHTLTIIGVTANGS